MASLNPALEYAEPAVSGGRGGLLMRVWRRRGLFALVFCAVLGAALLALAILPVRYLASGSVIVAEQEPGAHDPSPAWAQKIGDPADLESQLLVIRSPRVLRLALARPGVRDAILRECRYDAEHVAFSWLIPGRAALCEKLQPDSEDLIAYAEARYRVGSVGRSRVINIAYQSPLPEVAQTMANALITAFLDDQKSTLSTSRESAASWIWRELGQIDSELRQQDAKVTEFRRAKGLMRGANAPISSERLTSITQQLSSAEAARAEAAARLREIAADRARGAASAPAVLASRTIADLKQQIATASGQYASAANVLGPMHPTLRALQREREILEERLAKEIASIADSAQKTYDAADALVGSLKKQAEIVKAEVAGATADEASIESMVRSAEIKRQQYSELYKKASELETERRVLLGSTRLVSLAELPNKPFFPKTIPFLAGGLALAAMAAFAAALLRDRSDRSVRTSGALAVAVGAPVFAQLPRLAGRARFFLGRSADLPLGVALQDARRDPALQDALRRLFAGMTLAGGDRLRKILVTSPGLSEGKTFTTLALAQLVAASGRRVVAIECDMRRPTFSEALNLPDSAGLSGVLAGASTLRDALIATDIPNLDVIPAGRPTSASTELLMGRRMAELLRWAGNYDLVLIDSPPAGVLMDACILARHVDGALLCARWGRSSATAAAAAVDGLRAAGGDVLGVAITLAPAGEVPSYDQPRLPAVAYLAGQ